MKTRIGFVSNSSSSSFICPRRNFASVFHLGKEMLKVRNEDWNKADWNKVDDEELQKEIRKLERAEELGINPNTPIVFSTTNYETFIRLNSDQTAYDVNTCNNQDWSQIPELNGAFFSDEEELSTRTTEIYFWWVAEGIIGKPVTDQNTKWKQFILDNKIKHPWPKCPFVDRHFKAMVESVDGKIECVECHELAKKPDMILIPAKKVLLSSAYIIKPRLKLR
jgi:hypothetical protein